MTFNPLFMGSLGSTGSQLPFNRYTYITTDTLADTLAPGYFSNVTDPSLPNFIFSTDDQITVIQVNTLEPGRNRIAEQVLEIQTVDPVTGEVTTSPISTGGGGGVTAAQVDAIIANAALASQADLDAAVADIATKADPQDIPTIIKSFAASAPQLPARMIGDIHIVGATWAAAITDASENDIAYRRAPGAGGTPAERWEYVTPQNGATVIVGSAGEAFTFNGTEWFRDTAKDIAATKADEADLVPIAAQLNTLQTTINETFAQYLKDGTEASLADVANAVNTTGKIRGSQVVDAATGVAWHSRGPLPSDDWYDPATETRIFGKSYFRTIRPGVGVIPFVMLAGGQSWAVGNSNNVILNNDRRPEVTIFSPNVGLTNGSFSEWNLETPVFLGNADPQTGQPGFNATTGTDNSFAAQLAWLLNDHMDIPVVVILCARSNTGMTGQEFTSFVTGHSAGPTNGWVGGQYEAGGPNPSDLEVLQDKIVTLALSLIPGTPGTIDLMVRDQGQTSEVNAGDADNSDRYFDHLSDYRDLLLARTWFNENIPWVEHQTDEKIALTNVDGVVAAKARAHDDPAMKQVRVVGQGGGSLFDGFHPTSRHYRTMAERDFQAITGYGSFIGNTPGIITGSTFLAAEWSEVPFDIEYSMPPSAGNEDQYGAAHLQSASLNGKRLSQTYSFDITTIGDGKGPVFLPVYPALVPYWPGASNGPAQIQFLSSGGSFAYDLSGTVFSNGRVKLQRALYGSTARLATSNPVQVGAGNVAPGLSGFNFSSQYPVDDERFSGINAGDMAYFSGFRDSDTEVAGVPVNTTVFLRPLGQPVSERTILPGNVSLVGDFLNFVPSFPVSDAVFSSMNDGSVCHLRPNPANPTNILVGGVNLYETDLYWSRVNAGEPRSGRLHLTQADAMAGTNPIDLTAVGAAGTSMGTIVPEVFIARENRTIFVYPTEADALANTNRFTIANAPGAIGPIGFFSLGEAPGFVIDSLDKRVIELVQGDPPDAFVSGQRMILTVESDLRSDFYAALVRDIDTLGANRIA